MGRLLNGSTLGAWC